MKKSRLLALTLAVAVLLMGAGYALWSENLEINAEICTGELDFEFDAEYLGSHCYADGSVEVVDDGHTIELSLSNMSPGEESKFEICIENTGTIGLEVKDVNVTGINDALDQITIDSKSIEDYFTDLFEGKVLEPGEKDCETVVFYVDWEADEDAFPEDICFDLLIEADVTQSCYVENGNGGEDEPGGDEDPIPTGLKFVGGKTGYCGYCYVTGKLYLVYDDGSEEFIKSVNQLIGCWNGSTTVSHGGFSLNFTTDAWGFLSW